MWFAMFLGMAMFMVVTIALAAQGSVALSNPTSLEFQFGMGVFMLAPMTAWMRLRGCSWSECGQMGAAMMLSTPCHGTDHALSVCARTYWVYLRRKSASCTCAL